VPKNEISMAHQPQTNQTETERKLRCYSFLSPDAVPGDKRWATNQMPTGELLAFGMDEGATVKPTVRHKPYHNMSKHSPRPLGCGAAIFAQRRSDYSMLSPNNRNVVCLDLNACNHQTREHHQRDGDRPQRTRARWCRELFNWSGDFCSNTINSRF